MHVLLRQRPRVDQLYAVRGQQRLVLGHLVRRQRVHVGLGYLGRRRRPRQRRVVLRQVRELGRRQLVVRVVVTYNAKTKLTTSVINHLNVEFNLTGGLLLAFLYLYKSH